LAIESLGLSANQWQFLNAPDKYVKASSSTERKLVLESTRRQFRTARDILARLNGSYGAEPKRGILLADDVGLGKTTVAALVAWVVVSAGERRRVRILAPNDVMMRRWE
jgi:RecG-like helicase